jgi:uncharacterized membrane protein YfcA
MWPLKQKWFWTLFLGLLAVLIGAFLVVFLVVSLSPEALVLTLIVVLILWVVVRSYRNWVANKPEEESRRQGLQWASSLSFRTEGLTETLFHKD